MPWATPSARDWRSGSASEETHDRNARPLSEQVTRHESAAGHTHESSEDRHRSGHGKPHGSCWPTPCAQDVEQSGHRPSGRNGLTVTAREGAWPTPNAEGGTGYLSGSNRNTWRPTLEGAARGMEPELHQTVKPKPAAQGSLNPAWVSQLMGAPDGWLDVPLSDETMAAMRDAEREHRSARRSSSGGRS